MSATAGYQSWRNLSFLHWRVPPDLLRPLLPSELEVEQFDGSAWLGFVPFSMERIRPWWSPPVPGISWFLETNVRTYVRHRNGTSGVWFFSLDASSRIAVTVARRFWNLPYFAARLKLNLSRHGALQNVRCEGFRHNDPSASYRLEAEFPDSAVPESAVAGSLEHFLVERYTLFARSRTGQMFTGTVIHPPYLWSSLKCSHSSNGLLGKTFGIDPHRLPDHAVFSRGVDVTVCQLQSVPQ